ncbi:MAG: CotH kinase family protein [Clostridia bacterium]|nr:CotH kinase family protein [Clostridia bacterium]
MKRLMILLSLLLLTAASAMETASAEGWYPQITEEMPVIRIDTADGSSGFITDYVREDKLLGHIDYTDAVVSVGGCGEAYVLAQAKAQVKARGNWTLNYPKKSIRIKFAGKQGMLGLNEGRAYKNWVLLADWKDLSMINQPVGLYLAHAILGADGYYCTDYRSVEVYVNGEYWGVYLLAEQQEVNPGRVEVTEPGKDYIGKDIGYFFEYDAYWQDENRMPGDSGDPTFDVYHAGVTGEQQGYTIKSDINADRQRSFLGAYVRRVYQIAWSAVHEGKHYAFNEARTALRLTEGTSVQETVAAVIDLRSLVDTYILNEIVCNPDIGWSSFYLSVDLGEGGSGLLTFEAPWDFDSAFGIRAGYESNTGLYAADSGNPWLRLFAGEAWFQEMIRARWAELRQADVPDTALALILSHKETYAAHYARNYERWPERIAEGNGELIDELNACRTQGEAADYLYRWLEGRFQYLDGQWQ